MTNVDRYRQSAMHCAYMAGQIKNREIREAWLAMERSYRFLLQRERPVSYPNSEYLKYARDCEHFARLAQAPEHRERLFEMVREWMALAALHQDKVPEPKSLALE